MSLLSWFKSEPPWAKHPWYADLTQNEKDELVKYANSGGQTFAWLIESHERDYRAKQRIKEHNDMIAAGITPPRSISKTTSQIKSEYWSNVRNGSERR